MSTKYNGLTKLQNKNNSYNNIKIIKLFIMVNLKYLGSFEVIFSD